MILISTVSLEGYEARESEEAALLCASAEAGDAVAQYNLGVMYVNGQGVPQDNEQAVQWFRAAAEQGLADPQDQLGLMYIHGRGVAQNYTEAFTVAEKAELWDRWKRAGVLKSTGRAFGEPSSSVYHQLTPHGGDRNPSRED